MSFNVYLPTRVLFGAGKLNELKNQKMPGKKALLVISNGKSTKENGYLARTEEQLRSAGVETVLFDKVQSNPIKSTVMDGAALARDKGCDFIVALGGGSVMDAAKAIALIATNEETSGIMSTLVPVKELRLPMRLCPSLRSPQPPVQALRWTTVASSPSLRPMRRSGLSTTGCSL
jgi:alcohol dehydrogenase class IV